MATEHGGARPRVVVKGAPEVVLELCATAGGGAEPLDGPRRDAWRGASARLADRALRTLAIAEAEGARLEGGLDAIAGRLVLLGLVAEEDPPRPGASRRSASAAPPASGRS
jgi:cation-transporting ATPase I